MANWKGKVMEYNIFQEIKSRFNMSDIVSGYGFEINRSGFCLCPFHEEKTPSMKIYEKGYYCFGCCEGGDHIKFVQKLFNLENPLDAAKKINEDFGLGLDFNHKPTKEEFISAKNIVAERQQFERDEQIAYNAFTDYFKILLDYGRQYAPKSESEVLDKRFVEYLHNFERLDYTVNRMIEIMRNPMNERKEFLKDNEDYLVTVAERLLEIKGIKLQHSNEISDDKAPKEDIVHESAETPAGEKIQPKQMIGDIIGNTPYRSIQNKSYLKYSNAVASQIADKLQKNGIAFSGRVYPHLTTFTVNKKDLDKLRSIAENVTKDFTAKNRPQLIPSQNQQKQMTAAHRQQSHNNEISL